MVYVLQIDFNRSLRIKTVSIGYSLLQTSSGEQGRGSAELSTVSRQSSAAAKR